jgi:hypothetical protein
MELADRWRNTHWETLRGVWFPDTNRELILVKAPLERVGQALAGIGYRWQRDVLGKQVVIVERALIAYRIHGHTWSCIVGESFLGMGAQAELCPALSAQLKTSVIYYSVGKTAGVRGYMLYRDGKELESFYEPGEGGIHFASKRRRAPGKVADARQFTDEFLRSQDALDSGITFEYFLRSDNRQAGSWQEGEAKTLQDLGMAASFWDGDAVTRPPIGRVDFLAPPECEI